MLAEEEAKTQLKKLIDLNAASGENEWFEFKEAKIQFDFTTLGQYFSALSNEANLKKQRSGWLVLGVSDSGEVVGTSWKSERRKLDELKFGISQKTNHGMTFEEIYNLEASGKRVLLLQIPAAPPGIPTSWDGFYYGRSGSSLVPLSIDELERIRGQILEDWSAQLCAGATIHDLDPVAIAKARVEYVKRNANLAEDVPSWSDVIFLNKLRLAVDDGITRAAIILLGKEESVRFLSPSLCEIAWIREDERGNKLEFRHFGPPIIMAVDDIFSKINNPRYSYNQSGTLFPDEVQKYDSIVIRELLHNCIAHSDYKMMGRITLIESKDKIVFMNNGYFIPGSIEKVMDSEYMPPYYRNYLLAHAMVNLNMIETITSGIVKVFENQRKKLFPLPDYDLSESERVKVTLYGSILNEDYARQLLENTALPLSTVILLDKVQKGIRISKEEATLLKKIGVIEGRYPGIYISSKVAVKTGDTAAYIKHKAFNDIYYKDLIIKMIAEAGSVQRQEIEELLMDKLPDVLSDKQKETKVKNLIQSLRREGKIEKIKSPRKGAQWIIKDGQNQ